LKDDDDDDNDEDDDDDNKNCFELLHAKRAQNITCVWN